MLFFRYIVSAFTYVFQIGAAISFAVLIAAVLIQVVGRTTGVSPVWTEELTRLGLLYLVAFGAALSLRTGDLVNVDVISEALPARLSWLLRLLSATVTLAMSIYLLLPAWRFVSIGKMQTSPAMGLRMDQAHFTIWLLLAGLAIFSAMRIVEMLFGMNDGRPLKIEGH